MAETTVVVEDKAELISLASNASSSVSTVQTNVSSAKGDLSNVSNYDGLDVASAASTISANLDTVYSDLDDTIKNINTYANSVAEIDTNSGEISEEDYLSLFASDGSADGNARAIWNFLKAKGLSDAAAAGVLGNIQAECNFRLTAVGDNGTSFGLIQWHSGRWNNLNSFCSQHGLDPNSLQGQLEFLWAESLDPNTSYGKSLAQRGFYTTDSAVEAAVAFHDAVEKSASSADTVRNKRGGYASNWYSKLTGTDPGINLADTNSFISTNASNAAAVATNTVYSPNTSSYIQYTDYSSSTGPAPTKTTTTQGNKFNEQSDKVNVNLKPQNMTAEQYKKLFKSSGSKDDNAKVAWNFLKAKGLSDEAASGILGNMQAECNFDILAVGDNGTSFGLIQWHGGNWTKLSEYCKKNNLDENSLQGQLEYLWEDYIRPESALGKQLSNAGFFDSKSPVDAAVTFHDICERSASSAETVRTKRGGFATDWYSKLKGTSFTDNAVEV